MWMTVCILSGWFGSIDGKPEMAEMHHDIACILFERMHIIHQNTKITMTILIYYYYYTSAIPHTHTQQTQTAGVCL